MCIKNFYKLELGEDSPLSQKDGQAMATEEHRVCDIETK